MKFITAHIEIIRNFFLSPGDEAPGAEIASFITQLKLVFNSPGSGDEALYTLLKNIGAEDQLEIFQQLQQDYFSRLALLHVAGNPDPDIDILVKNDHPGFLAEVDFQKDLVLALRLQERNALKQKFQELDKDSEISSEEIALAFRLGERQELKDQFRSLEHTMAPSTRPAARVIPFNWKQLAVAASVIGIILTTTFYVFDKTNVQQDTTFVSKNGSNKNADSLANRTLLHNQASGLLAGTLVPQEKQSVVLKETSLGFAAKDEKVQIRIYDLHSMITELKASIAKMQLLPGFNNTIDSLKVKVISLINLENKYSFNSGTLSIYLQSQKEIKLFKIDSGYYMQVDGILYECKKSSIPITLKLLTNDIVREKINKIIFINSN